MKRTNLSNIKLGIIGGGQLARMLALAGAPLGIEVHILSEKESDPAAMVTRHWHQADPTNEKEQTLFCQNMDFVTFESEFFDMRHFELLTHTSKCIFFPHPKAMSLLRHRLTQKDLLVGHKIRTAKHMSVQNIEDLERAITVFKNGFVLKKSIGGYDGYGTYYYRSNADLKKLKPLLPGDYLAEEFITFKRELAVIFVRSLNGDFIHLPLVQSKQTDSRCDWVKGPMSHPALPATVQQFKKFLRQINYVGCMGVEFFDTGKELLINELAPRVHNSGHYSQNALATSQFEYHLIAGLGGSLPEVQLHTKAFAMANLLGQGNDKVIIPHSDKVFLHWYGKRENKKGRKLGHINSLANTSSSALEQALKERKRFIL